MKKPSNLNYLRKMFDSLKINLKVIEKSKTKIVYRGETRERRRERRPRSKTTQERTNRKAESFEGYFSSFKNVFQILIFMISYFLESSQRILEAT